MSFLWDLIKCKLSTDFPQLRHVKARASPAIQADAVKKLIVRLIGTKASMLNVNVNESIGPVDRDTFEVQYDFSFFFL